MPPAVLLLEDGLTSRHAHITEVAEHIAVPKHSPLKPPAEALYNEPLKQFCLFR